MLTVTLRPDLSNRWLVYIIQADDNSLYTGITTDLKRRWLEHCQRYQGTCKKGAKYFAGRCPEKVLLVEFYPDRSEASRREAAIKKMSRRQKLVLIHTN